MSVRDARSFAAWSAGIAVLCRAHGGLRLARSTRSVLLASMAAALVASGSCDSRSPNTPSLLPGGSLFVELEIAGPNSIAPGATVQLSVRGRKRDGTVATLSDAEWTSSNANVLAVDAGGRASGRAPGEAVVWARAHSRVANTTIMVLPDGTFRLVGQVREAGIVLNGATVSVVDGTGAGQSARTDNAGLYALYGVAGRIRLHATREGYQPLMQDVTVDAHQTLNLELALVNPRPNLTGAYAFTFAARDCPSPPMPAEALHRTYGAEITQQGPQLTVRLTDADFILTNGRGNGFSGTLSPESRVTFQIGTAYYYYGFYSGFSEVVERFDSTATLLIGGFAEGRYDAGTIRGTISGGLALAQRTMAPFYPYSAVCYSRRHEFELRRR